MPVRQETNARFLRQVSIKSQNERKSKQKLLWAEKNAKWRSRRVKYDHNAWIYLWYTTGFILYISAETIAA